MVTLVSAVMFAACAAVFVLVSLAASASATQSLSLTVSGPESVNGVDDFKITATVVNTGNETLKILNSPHSPLSRHPTNIFAISDASSGATPDFTGVKMKYAPKQAMEAGSYTTLAPGESTEVEHSLGNAYNFTGCGVGTYEIRPSTSFLVVNDDGSVSKIQATTNATSAAKPGSAWHTTKLLGGKPLSSTQRRYPSPHARRALTYVGCTSSQQSTLVSAAAQAQTYAAQAYNYTTSLSATGTVTSRYTTWFGTFGEARYETVLQHFTNLNNNTFSDYTFDCTCSEDDVYAYVYPDTFGYVYVCGAFWDSPLNGTDSQGGTIIHESSHFTKNAGTQDHVYGQRGCKALAISDPDEATDNADSHEYYAENNPALS